MSLKYYLYILTLCYLFTISMSSFLPNRHRNSVTNYLTISSKGKIKYFNSQMSLLWTSRLPHKLIQTKINVKHIHFDKPNVLPGEDGLFYYINPKEGNYNNRNSNNNNIHIQVESLSNSSILKEIDDNYEIMMTNKMITYAVNLSTGELVQVVSGKAKAKASKEMIMNEYMFLYSMVDKANSINQTIWKMSKSELHLTETTQFMDGEAEECVVNDYELIHKHKDYHKIYKIITDRDASDSKHKSVNGVRIINLTNAYEEIYGKGSHIQSSHIRNNYFNHKTILLISILLIALSYYNHTKASTVNAPLIASDKFKFKTIMNSIKWSNSSDSSNVSQISTKVKSEMTINNKDVLMNTSIKDNINNSNNNNNYWHHSKNRSQDTILPPETHLSKNCKTKTAKDFHSLNICFHHKLQSSMTDNNIDIKLRKFSEANTGSLNQGKTKIDKSFDNWSNKVKYNPNEEEMQMLSILTFKYLQDVKTNNTNTVTNSNTSNCCQGNMNVSSFSYFINNTTQKIISTNLNWIDPGRFARTFTNIQMIGKGGFGSVYKAQHSIDGCEYAIKVIKFKLREGEDLAKAKVWTEIKTMMKVEHKNIVRYITSWFELEDGKNCLSNDNNNNNTIDKLPGRALSTGGIPKRKAQYGWKDLEKVGNININTNTNNNNNNNNCEEEFELVIGDCNSRSKKIIDFSYDDDIDDDNKSLPNEANENNANIESNEDISSNNSFKNNIFSSFNSDESNVSDEHPRKKQVPSHCPSQCHRSTYPWYFYIQMEYCDGIPLNYILLNRKENLSLVLISFLFSQIANAVKHIHRKSIIHRDLKPANIFIKGKFKAKIGDFGLASDKNSRENVGTFIYQSPEQIEGKVYSEKVDIYALGCILLEMILWFKTETERKIVWMNIRKKIYPVELGNVQEYIQRWIKNMTCYEEEKRWSIDEIMNSEEMSEMLSEIS